MKTFKCKKRDEKDYQEYKADSMRIDDAGNLLFRASEDPDEVPRIIGAIPAGLWMEAFEIL